MSKELMLLRTRRTPAECQFLAPGLYNHYIFSQPDADGLTIVRTKYRYNGNLDAQSQDLETLKRSIQEDNPVIQVTVEDYKYYGVTQDGELWLANFKGHDQHHIRLKDYHKITFQNLFGSTFTTQKVGVSDVYLVGEGNALRNVRRWIQFLMTNPKNVFTTADLEEMCKRSNCGQVKILIRFDSGHIFNVNEMRLLDLTDQRWALTLLTCLVEGFQQCFAADKVRLVEPRKEMTRALQVATMYTNS